jgi:hypothetical protein
LLEVEALESSLSGVKPIDQVRVMTLWN